MDVNISFNYAITSIWVNEFVCARTKRYQITELNVKMVRCYHAFRVSNFMAMKIMKKGKKKPKYATENTNKTGLGVECVRVCEGANE